MKIRFTFILIFALTITTWAQTGDGNCRCPSDDPAGGEPAKMFKLTNGKTIAACGVVETYNNESLISGFLLLECEQNNEIAFWDTFATCKIKANQDTLIVEELRSLPIGDNFAYELTVWRIDKIYFKSGQVQREGRFNKTIKKYSQQEISKVLTEVEAIKGKWTYDNFNVIDKLFMAAISGDNTARRYLTDETRFEWVDGASNPEGYHDIINALKNWE